jgi:hypothetical protein
MFKGKVLLFSLLLVFATTAYAGDVDNCQSEWGWGNVNCAVPRIAICPQGDFEYIREGCGFDDDYIWVTVLDQFGAGSPAFPGPTTGCRRAIPPRSCASAPTR